MTDRKWFENISDKEAVEQKLAELKELGKKAGENGEKAGEEFDRMISDHAEELFAVLEEGDASLRKKVPALLARISDEETLRRLYRAYEKEETLYVRGAVLKAIAGMDHASVDGELEEVLKRLEKTELTEDNRKHLLKERELLIAMLGKGREKHKFTGYDLMSEMALLTNRDHKDLVMRELSKIPSKEFTAGVMVKTDRIREVLSCRLYEACFFILPGARTVSSDPVSAGRSLADAGLLEYIDGRHDGEAPYRFRVTLKRAENNDRGKFAERFAAAIEESTGFGLVHDRDDFEVEIRLIERTGGDFSVLIRFATLPDTRFSYRREVIAATIKPSNAALTVALANGCLKPGAVALDPFCGVGTMMTERMARVPVKAFYGVDIFGDAIKKAKKNMDMFLKSLKTKGKKPAVYFINRDFFEVELDHVIDEVITDMPFAMGKTTEADIEMIYERFFGAVDRILSHDGVILLYTRDMPLVSRFSKAEGFATVGRYEISAREGTFVCVLRRRDSIA